MARKISKKISIESTWIQPNRRRIYFLIFLITAISGLIFYRLFKIQVKAFAYYREKALNQHQQKRTILPQRGEIFIHEKEEKFPVAINQELSNVFLVPNEIENPHQVAAELARILNLSWEEILAKANKKNDFYEIIKKKISNEEEEKVAQLNLKGVYLEKESWRYYPEKELAAQIIGFVAFEENEKIGKYGIERQFEKELKGKAGFIDQERDPQGRWIAIGKREFFPQEDGKTIILTIDHVIQYKAELALKNAIKKHQASGGRIIIVEPQSGRILALVNYPSFNLNEFSKVEDFSLFLNKAISSPYECGSVFKSITMAAGIDSGEVEPETTFFDKGFVKEAGYIIENSDRKGHGLQTMTEVIEKSLNTGVIFVQEKIGKERFLKYVRNFGFGEKTGIELPGESSGNIKNILSNKRNIEYYTASFGQGIAVTPLQLVMAYAAIANGGELLKPQIVDSIIDTQGKQEKREREVRRKVISSQSAKKLALMLQSNVENGHGKLAGVPGFWIAGKTGTAQVPDQEKGGYKEDQTIGTFAGFGPVENPIFAMIVVIENPKGVNWAESTAAPVFGELAQFILNYFDVKPSREFSSNDLDIFNQKHNYLILEEEKEAKKDDSNIDSKEEKEKKE